MNLIFITENLDIGGTLTSTKNLLRELHTTNVSVILISFSEKNDLSNQDFFTKRYEKLFVENKNHFSIFRKAYSLFLKMRELEKSSTLNNVDAIVCDLLSPLLSFLLIKLFFVSLRKKKLVYIFHGSNSLEKLEEDTFYKKKYTKIRFQINKKLETFCLNKVNLIITYSDYSRKLLIQKFKIFPQIKRIYPGREILFENIRKKVTKSEARELLGLNKNTKIILVVSRLEPRKGVFQFLKTLKQTQAELKNTKILIVSDFSSSFHNSYTFFLEYKSLNMNNIFCVNTPPREQLALFYRASDVLVLPSLTLETFGFVTLEALTSGLPIVGFKIGANEELIDPRWLLTLNEKAKIIKKVNKLLSFKPIEYNRVSQRGINHSKSFSWRIFATEFCKTIESINT